MTKKNAAQKRALKRNARAKAKSISIAKGRNAPAAVADRESRRLARALGGTKLNFDDVLTNAVRQVNKGTNVEGEFKSPQEMLEGLKRNIGEVFKLYSYVAFVEALKNKQAFEHKLVIDIENISLSLIDIDRRFSHLDALLAADEEDAVMTEALDIGIQIQNISEELYSEIVRSEKYALIIEEAMDRLAEEVTDVTDVNQKRNRVLSTIAYQLLSEVQIKNTKKEESESSEPTTVEEAV